MFPKTEAKDRYVAAAAAAARKRSDVDAVTIVTWNLKHFERDELAKGGVAAENPDVFPCRLLASSPENVTAAFMRMRDNLRNPAKTTREGADTLAAQGLKKFAELITTELD